MLLKHHLVATAFLLATLAPTWAEALPYQQAGLNAQQAAHFLLSRTTFGALPGQADQLAAEGLENWLERQLQGEQPELELDARLSALPSTGLSSRELRQVYLTRKQAVDLAEKQGLPPFSDGSDRQRQIYEARLRELQKANGWLFQDDLFDELRHQKLLRVRYSQNQLREVMTDFWFNHFNVAAQGEVRMNVLDYEAQGLRPAALGNFSDLLFFTAKHPAMLHYLNNTQSSARPGCRTTLNERFEEHSKEDQSWLRDGQPLTRKNGGLNENYAREVMELHTLGVDGGYQQSDVTDLARALSGWTVFYQEAENPNLEKVISPGGQLGYIRQGDFLFRADWHDAEAKSFLGQPLKGKGLGEGEAALQKLVIHPATARRLSFKLCQRFVSDEPAAALVARVAQTFSNSQGQLQPTLRSLFYSKEFWEEAKHPSKIKSPLEFWASCVRQSGADIQFERGHFYWIQRLGQPLYLCAPPTGYPEDSREWVSSGNLVNRINFANLLAQGRMPGLEVKWPDLGPKELAQMLLPGREVDLKELAKLANPGDGYPAQPAWFRRQPPADLTLRRQRVLTSKMAGVLLGSPAFQYR